jgi:hypothetical protein
VDVFFFRLSLKPVAEPDAFEVRTRSGAPFSREEWLRTFFSETRTFTHWASEFAFIPAAQDQTFGLPSHLIVGWIARPLLVQERTPPSVGFMPTRHQSWRGALIVIDPTDHADGQKIAMEKRADIGEPHAILRSLARQMRIGDAPQPFIVEIFAIIQPSSFWRFAEEHDFKIKILTFDVAVPNMFGGADEFSQELRELHQRNNVSRVRTTLVSDGAIDPRSNRLDEVVDYTEQGAGQIKAQAVDGARYNSQHFASHARLDAHAEMPDFWARLSAWLQGRF